MGVSWVFARTPHNRFPDGLPMSPFSAPIAEAIWDMKYRFKAADGTPIDGTV